MEFLQPFDGKYMVMSEIGRGGYGIVYKALQLGLNRVVALKVLSGTRFRDGAVRERFRREADVIKQLIHPNTIRIIDVGEDFSELFIVTEYLEGRSLDAMLRQEKALSSKRVFHIVRQIAKSLGEAHRAGIIHRDLKPANVFMRDVYGEKDFVKVLDFGIAKSFCCDEGCTPLTRAGVALGTPRYMAPEIFLGQKPGPHTDIYALGLLSLYMLTGSLPVPSGTMNAMQWHTSPSPVAFPASVAAQPLLSSWLRKACEKDALARYACVEDFLKDLDIVEAKESSDIPLPESAADYCEISDTVSLFRQSLDQPSRSLTVKENRSFRKETLRLFEQIRYRLGQCRINLLWRLLFVLNLLAAVVAVLLFVI